MALEDFESNLANNEWRYQARNSRQIKQVEELMENLEYIRNRYKETSLAKENVEEDLLRTENEKNVTEKILAETSSSLQKAEEKVATLESRVSELVMKIAELDKGVESRDKDLMHLRQAQVLIKQSMNSTPLYRTQVGVIFKNALLIASHIE